MNTAAIKHGCQHEKDAVNSFREIASRQHQDLRFFKSGLVLSSKYPQLGASPDALANCKCCEPNPVEVKCPFSARNSSIEDASYFKNFCLKKKSANFSLDKNHKDYFQCQMQMALLESKFRFFVVWTHKETYIEKFCFDEEFWRQNYLEVQDFCQQVLLPELLGKYYTKKKRALEDASTAGPQKKAAVLYCICKKPEKKISSAGYKVTIETGNSNASHRSHCCT